MDPDQAKSPCLVYGEIDFFSFAAIMEKVGPEPGEVFVDLGHGTGRAVVAAVSSHAPQCRARTPMSDELIV